MYTELEALCSSKVIITCWCTVQYMRAQCSPVQGHLVSVTCYCFCTFMKIFNVSFDVFSTLSLITTLANPSTAYEKCDGRRIHLKSFNVLKVFLLRQANSNSLPTLWQHRPWGSFSLNSLLKFNYVSSFLLLRFYDFYAIYIPKIIFFVVRDFHHIFIYKICDIYFFFWLYWYNNL